MSTQTSRNSSGSASASTSTSMSKPTKSYKKALTSTIKSPSTTTRVSPSPSKATQISKISPSTFETLLDNVHKTAKDTAKQDSTAEKVLLAKLACYAVRELHAQGIYPTTALRAMTILEFSTKKRSTGGAIKQAKREVRDEHRVLREGRDREAEAAGGHGEAVDEGFHGEGDGGFGGIDGFGGRLGGGDGTGEGVLVELTRD